MVRSKVNIIVTLLCCFLLVAASGSPAKAAEEEIVYYVEGVVPNEYVCYFEDYLCERLSKYNDYLLFSTTLADSKTYLCVVGNFSADGNFYQCEVYSACALFYVEDELYLIPYDLDSPMSGLVINDQRMLIHGNVGSNMSIFERSDIYAFTALLMLGTGLCCYLLRSIFGFNLRSRG